ncbi:MAG: methyltransferase domain-containing protein [Candidatus Omnitrophica bacterium]|nr:methyltransferase domain-containing protein [Candidatus Omnitrophota bacterium]
MMKKFFLSKIISVFVAGIFMSHLLSYGLAPVAGFQNPVTKRKLLAALADTEIIYADTPEAVNLLKRNNTSGIILSTGKYLVSGEIKGDEIGLLRIILHENIEALMQILEEKDPERYKKIKDIVLSSGSHDAEEGDIQEIYFYVNHKVARLFEWLILLEQGMVFDDEIPLSAKELLNELAPRAFSGRGHIFTPEFWDPVLCRKRIDKEVSGGMRFVMAKMSGSFSEADKERAGRMARAYLRRKEELGIEVNASYTDIIAQIFLRLGLTEETAGKDPEEIFKNLLKENRIRNILEVGCGDCAFLAAISEDARHAEVDITGIDLNSAAMNGSYGDMARERGVELIETDVRSFANKEKYDIIISSGVLSLFGAHTEEKDRFAGKGLTDIIRKSNDMAKSAVQLLSEHEKAAFYANTFTSLVMLYRDKVEKYADVITWDNTRKCSFMSVYKYLDDDRVRKMWSEIWDQGASLAVIAKKGAFYDFTKSRILAMDVMDWAREEERVYELRYDESRLTPSQIDVIKAYAETLREKFGAGIKVKPCSSANGSRESIIAVYCEGEAFKGEGHIEVEVPEGDLEEYVLRLSGMLNIAFASASIDENASLEDLKTGYARIINYIKDQYSSIIGSELEIFGGPEQILNTLRYVKILLPKADRLPPGRIREYNELARKLLISA